MDLKLEIICKNFKHKRIIENKIKVNEKSEEYYIIPLNKSFNMETDGEVFKLTFNNQLLWLKYSNYYKEILIKEFNCQEYIIISSKDILDIYINIHCNNCFKKNVWHSQYKLNLNKKYINKYFLIIPIFEDMIDIKKYGEGIENYQIHMMSNEILLKQAKKRSNSGCNLMLNNNVILNKEALLIPLNEKNMEKFIPIR